MRHSSRLISLSTIAASSLLVLAAGSAGASDPAVASHSPGTAQTAPDGACASESSPLRIVLVNDDGMINPAIDIMLDYLNADAELHLDITVVSPADERSGSSDSTTPEGVSFEESTTPGGNPGYAVDGYPADAVLVALNELGLDPHLVLSGINPGQNFGPFAAFSGTVGAARTAARQGVPALAVSGGLDADPAQFEFGAGLAREWIAEHCEALVAGEHPTDTITSINFPACPPDQIGPLQEVPRAEVLPEGLEDIMDAFISTCDLADPAPADDVTAVRAGYPSITNVELELEIPTDLFG